MEDMLTHRLPRQVVVGSLKSFPCFVTYGYGNYHEVPLSLAGFVESQPAWKNLVV